MRILIYEPLADINKAPFFSNFASKLASEGHDVVIACEQRVIYTLQGKLTSKGVINCTSPICAYIAINKAIRYTCFMPNKALFKKLTQKSLANKLNVIATLRKDFYTPLLTEFKPDLIYIWNGQAEHQQDFVMLAKNMGFKFNYIEHGWFPQKDYYYTDPEGVNARSSIAKNAPPKINKAQKDKLKKWLSNYTKKYKHITEKPKQILVPLQVDTDTNITLHSPYKSMKDFITYLEGIVPDDFSVILRPHPLGGYEYPINSNKSNFTVDSETELHHLIAESEYVIGINSTVLLEALCFDKKILALGSGLINHKGQDTISMNLSPQDSLKGCSNLLYMLIFNHQKIIPYGYIRKKKFQKRNLTLNLFKKPKAILYSLIIRLILLIKLKF